MISESGGEVIKRYTGVDFGLGSSVVASSSMLKGS